MKQKEIRPVSRKEAQSFAVTVLEKNDHARVTGIQYVGGGSFGFVYKAEIDKAPLTVIMKACRTEGICAREASELALLGADSLIKIPKVYFTFLATAEIPMDFIAMECVPGTNCFTDFAKLLNSKKTKERFADEITTIMRHWHAQTNDKFGLIGHAVNDEWLDYYQPFASEILDCARSLSTDGKLEKNVLDAMERAWAAFDYIFSEKVEKPSLIHGDLNVMNIMSDKRLRPLAIIDPLESKWADPEYELFQLRNLTGDRFGLYETYKAKYPVSEKCDLKTSFYALYHEVYAYIISGTKVNFILQPLVKRMNRELDQCNL
ncbi:MAG: fructosamine kinase family protein [Clostridia bacterium]|nr:fructosamine kinase family protein [Clostridia bacterium]